MQGFAKKNTTRPKGGVEIFFANPKGTRDLAGQGGHGITFAKNLSTSAKGKIPYNSLLHGISDFNDVLNRFIFFIIQTFSSIPH
jgi:hypothetical protein